MVVRCPAAVWLQQRKVHPLRNVALRPPRAKTFLVAFRSLPSRLGRRPTLSGTSLAEPSSASLALAYPLSARLNLMNDAFAVCQRQTLSLLPTQCALVNLKSFPLIAAVNLGTCSPSVFNLLQRGGATSYNMSNGKGKAQEKPLLDPATSDDSPLRQLAQNASTYIALLPLDLLWVRGALHRGCHRIGADLLCCVVSLCCVVCCPGVLCCVCFELYMRVLRRVRS